MVKDTALVATRLRVKNVAMRGAFSADRFPSVEIVNVIGISNENRSKSYKKICAAEDPLTV